MPAGDVDEQPAAGPPTCRRRARGTGREHRRDLAALGPNPGTRNARPGAIARIAASSAGAVAPTTSPTVPPGPQPAARRATRAQSGSAG